MFHVHQPVIRLGGYPYAQPCPSCGYCPTCGRRGHYCAPVPVMPWQPPVVIYPHPVIHAGPTNTQQAINRLAGRTA